MYTVSLKKLIKKNNFKKLNKLTIIKIYNPTIYF